ncbi:MAG: THxN family PEP-CTERM protein [Azoarcus sp.]|jgi:hypothetical protein|nr:THxN family PEP-CTERM protein [Azoarcus sp.]
MKKETIRTLFATGILACAASASHAAVVNNWDFVLDMQWDTQRGKTVFSAGMWGVHPGIGSTSVSSSMISWGATGGSFNSLSPNTARSGLEITRPNAVGSIGTSFEGQTPVTAQANMFTHHNRAISGTFQSLTRASMDVSVQLMLPGTGDSVVNIGKTFDVHFFETPNVGGQCVWGLCDNDIFAVISGMDLTSTFTYDGQQYVLNYFEATDHIKPLSNLACKEMGFAGGACYGFTTFENSRTDVNFNLSITAVPEPETYAMLLAGLGLVGAVVRRRRNALNVN